ncbi:DUF1351 domain-containing protein [Jeotgalibaca porci]|uniref:DUF1351 domain-containing protein n=1 Tax=Jeotgalibaca porci TaxID=1868793 RepID=UPI0035A18392
MNELMTTSVKLQPGKIELENKAQLNSMIDELLKKYDNALVSVETEKEAKKQRAELNKVKTALSEFRIEKKKAYLEPLEVFENDIKGLVEKLDKVIEDIGGGLKELDEQQRQERAKRVEELLEEYGKGFDIIQKPSWLNKTAKETHTIDDIKDQVRELEIKAKQRIEAIDTIREVCETNNLTPDGYIQLLESGAGEVLQIIKSINDAAEAKREREAKEKELALIEEQKKQQEEAYNEEVAKLEAEKLEATEPSNEELAEASNNDVREVVGTGEVFTSVLEIKFTTSQFEALNKALIASGVLIRELSTIEDFEEKLNELMGDEG